MEAHSPNCDDYSADAGAERRLRLQTAAILVVASLVAGLVVERAEHLRLQDARVRASAAAQNHLRALDESINRALSSTFALAALVRQGNGRIKDFTGTAQEMLPYYPGVSALQLAPDGIIRDIVPLAGNEKAVGHNLLQDRTRTREAFLARDTGQLTLAGPFDLVQGGLGAVGRLPVFLPAPEHSKRFWGFTTALIRFPEVLDTSGLSQLTAAGYDYVLWRVHPDSGERQVIASSGGQALRDPVEHPLRVPNGTWNLSVAPRAGWSDAFGLGVKVALGALFAALLTFSSSLLLRQPEKLRREVALRTRELQEREAILGSLNELATDWIWTQDASFRFTWFSSGMSRIMGTDPQRMLGRCRWEAHTTLDAAAWDTHRQLLAAHQPFRDFEYGIISGDGEVRHISTSGQPIFDADGKFAGYRGTAKNITSRKLGEQALVESETRFQSLFEKAPVALSVTTDEDGFRATRWNQTWLAAFGYPPEVAQGRSGNDIGLWVDPATHDYYITAAVELGGVSGIEAPMRCADGRLRRICVAGRFVEAGGHRLLITYYDDVTDARSNERAITELNATLETRIAERTRDLSEANRQLSETLESLRLAQDDLIRSEKMASLGSLVAGVAHELNTPIGNCLTVASAFADRTDAFAAQVEAGVRRSELLDYLSAARQGADLLTRSMHRAHELVTTFKQVAVDQSSENRRRFDLRTIVEEVAAMLHPSLKKTPWQLDVEVPPGIEMDSFPGPLDQVVVNLITNAMTHAFADRDHGRIVISGRQDGARVVLEVADDGIGMSPDVRQRAFDPFFTTRLGRGGSGLGLNIAFNIVNGILGGDIALHSTPGQGCRFVIRMPAVAPQRAAAEGVPQSAA